MRVHSDLARVDTKECRCGFGGERTHKFQWWNGSNSTWWNGSNSTCRGKSVLLSLYTSCKSLLLCRLHLFHSFCAIYPKHGKKAQGL
jgi:hypothetical protein